MFLILAAELVRVEMLERWRNGSRQRKRTRSLNVIPARS